MLGKERLALVSVVALAVLVLAAPVASAQGRCSVATLKGSYGLVEQGTAVVDIGISIPVPFPTANVAIVRYDGAGNCSVADLKGDYLLASQGVVGPPDARQPVAGVGLITYNGRGNFYGNGTVNLDGTPLQNPFTGTYIVNANCSVSGEVLDAIGTAHLTGVLVGQGANQEVRFLITDPGTVLVGSIKRQ